MNFSVNDLLDSYFVATTTTAGTRIPAAMKIRKFEAWSPPYTPNASTFQTNSMVFQWATPQSGIIGGPSLAISDTALGSNDCAHIVTVPPKTSLAGNWLSCAATSSDIIASFSCPPGTVVDLHVTLHLAEGGAGEDTPQPVVRTVAGATAGTFYLSGLPTSAQTLIPVYHATL